MSIYIKQGALYVPGAQDKIRQKGVERPAFLDDYTMIDIETTGLSTYRDRVTELGGVKVRSGKIAAQYSNLVKYPRNNRIPSFITRLNGITEEKIVAEGLPVAQAIKEFRDFIGSDMIVGYNVNFDLNFVYDLCQKYHLPVLNNDYVDVLRLARVFYPHQPNRLLDVMRRSGIAQTEQHHGLADSLDTIKVYNDLRTHFTPALLKKAQSKIKNIDLTADEVDYWQLGFKNPVDNKKIVLAGHLHMNPEEAGKMIQNMGGQVEKSVLSDTNLLVVGDHDFFHRNLPALQTERELAKEGTGVKAWSESFFLNRLDEWARS